MLVKAVLTHTYLHIYHFTDLKEGFDEHAGKNGKLNKKQLARLLMANGTARDPDKAADMAKTLMSKFDESG